jgi:hypothetical protein
MKVQKPTASKLESGATVPKRPRKRRADTVLVFDPEQNVPEHVLKTIIDEWLVPCLVEEFFRALRTRKENPQGGTVLDPTDISDEIPSANMENANPAGNIMQQAY